MKQFIKLIQIVFLVIFIAGCGGAKSSSHNPQPTNELTLNIDQVSTVPLTNNNPHSFYVYATNNGNHIVSDINWQITINESSASVNKQNIFHYLQNKFNDWKTSQLEKNSNESNNEAIIIKDQSECQVVAVGQSCRILLEVNKPGIYQLQAISHEAYIQLLGGAGVIQAEDYEPVFSGKLEDVLTVTPIGKINYSEDSGSASFFIVNNSPYEVILNKDELAANLPPNMSLVFGTCDSPLPAGGSCQVRVEVKNLTHSSDEELNVPLKLIGDIVSPDGKIATLPEQNSHGIISATSKNIGIIQYIYNQNILLDNSLGNLEDTFLSNIISNAGTNLLTISNIVSNNSILEINNDQCSGKSLGAGEICTYKVKLNVAQINSSGSSDVAINYINQADGENKVVNSNIKWTYIEPLPEAKPAISLTTLIHTLNQNTTSTVLTITNIGNVTLSNVTSPILSSDSNVVLELDTEKPCSGTLVVGTSCNYIVKYLPAPPSEIGRASLSGIHASYMDNHGVNKTVDFDNSVSLDLISLFAGSLSSSDTLMLNKSLTTGVITFTNIGNANVKISNISLESSSNSNIAITYSASMCQNNLELVPNQSCTVSVGIVNTQLTGSGNEVLKVIYDNSNGNTATNSNGSINWILGNTPSLNVLFKHNSLSTYVQSESMVNVTVINNGSYELQDLKIPVLNNGLSFNNGLEKSCYLGQSLAIGEECSLILKYHPISAKSTSIENLPSFSAKYTESNSGVLNEYMTGSLAITLTAIPIGELQFNPASIVQDVNWVSNSMTSLVEVSNISEVSKTITGITANDNQITTTGCINQTLMPGQSCTLSILGNYTALDVSKSINDMLIVKYVDTAGVKELGLNVLVNYIAKPVVTPSLLVNSNLFNTDVTQDVNESVSYTVELLNRTTATNLGNTSISIPYSGLLPTNDGNVTYSINTVGLTNKPCRLPENNAEMTLYPDEQCYYNLVLHTGGATMDKSSKSLVTSYKYNQYSNSSLSPTLSGVASVSNSFNLTIIKKLAQLSIHVENQDINNFNNIEIGRESPTMNFSITNIGTKNVIGLITPNLPLGFTAAFIGCENLAMNSSCIMQLTMSTNSLKSGNLNSSTLSYNNSDSIVTVGLPSVVYSVIPIDSPSISMTESISGCVTGNGVSNTCYNNPNTKGGTASSIKVILTFNNSSGTAAVDSLQLSSVSSALFESLGYRQITDSCTNGVGVNASCKIEYQISGSAIDTAIHPYINTQQFNYNYNYVTQQGQHISGTNTTSLIANIDIVNPVLTINPIADINKLDNKDVTIIASNLYQSTTPTITINITRNDDVATGVSSTSATCSSVSEFGSICSLLIETNNQAVVASNYKIIATASNINTISNDRMFNIIPGTVFIAVGSGDKYTSKNGTKWVDQLATTRTDLFYSITVNYIGRFVTVGANGQLLTSMDDGITWDNRVVTSNTIKNVTTINNSSFIAVGVKGMVLKSSNGIDWESRSVGSNSINLNAVVARDNGTVVAVGDGGVIYTSTNSGDSWSSRTSPTVNNLYGITVSSSGVFIAVGDAGTLITSNDSGANWTVIPLEVTNKLNSVKFTKKNSYIAVGNSGTILTSTNGSTWERIVTDSLSSNLTNITISDVNTYVIVGEARTILFSSDGLSWRRVIDEFPSTPLYGVTVDNIY